MGCTCFEGLYLLRSENSLACIQCPAGKYSSGKSNVCSPCPPATYNNRMSMAVCVPCPENYTAIGGATECITCTPPQIPKDDRSGCQDCPIGRVCLSGGDIISCPQGTYGPPEGGLTSVSQCLPCPPNKVCSDAITVEACPPNTHSVPGATSMLACECDFGFDCTYTKSVKGRVVLPVSSTDFETMRDHFIKAIAESAGKVQVERQERVGQI